MRNKSYKELIIRMLEDIGEGNTPEYNKYFISKEDFSSMVSYIKSKDLARGLNTIVSNKENNMKISGCINPYLTMNGIDYINANL